MMYGAQAYGQVLTLNYSNITEDQARLFDTHFAFSVRVLNPAEKFLQVLPSTGVRLLSVEVDCPHGCFKHMDFNSIFLVFFADSETIWESVPVT